ncbi:MAG: CHAT domain-containing tetratricopeptide repeat protein [Saprospiraceae bacterium]
MKFTYLFCLFFYTFSLFSQSSSIAVKAELTLVKSLLDQNNPVKAYKTLTTLVKNSTSFYQEDSLMIYSLMIQCHASLKDYEAAIKDYQKALTQQIQNDTLLGQIHDHMGRSFYQLADYLSATVHILEARDLYKKLYGKEDSLYISTFNTLGLIYASQARYSDAEKVFQEARQINQRKTGGGNIQYARIINNLADVYCKLNRFDQADGLYTISLRIKEKISGAFSKDYAKTLYNLANFQASLGRYEKAKSTILQGIAIYDSLKDTKSTEYLKFLDNLSILTEKTGDIKNAERLYLDALKRRELVGTIKSAEYAINLSNLGKFYIDLGKPEIALKYIEKAVPLTANVYGKYHPKYAGLLISMANIQSNQLNHDQAKLNYEEAIRIIQKTLGKDHIEYFHSQFEYAKFLRKTGKKEQAIALFQTIEKIPRNFLKRATRFLSELELGEKIKEYKSFIYEIYSFQLANPQDKNLAKLAYNISLYYRGFILSNLQRIRIGMDKARFVANSRDEVISLHRQLEFELNKAIGERANTTELERKISEMESQISHTIGSFSEESKEYSWEDIQFALSEGEAAVEFISFPVGLSQDTVFYGVLLVTKYADAPQFISLCYESEFENLLKSNTNRTADYVSSIYNFSSRGAMALGEKKPSLTELIWTPIREHLKEIQRIYLVPDGLLNRLNIAALPISLEAVVSDSFEIILMSSTRQIVPTDVQILAYSNKNCLVVSGVDYDIESTETFASRNSNPSTAGTQTKTWTALPWAEKEGVDVSKLLQSNGFKVASLQNTIATEKGIFDSLESKKNWRILHFATHGYFNTSKNQTPSSNFYGSGMMNSGLVLSGANSFQSIQNDTKTEDGLLSAYEISHLDLSQTELVVLSACETALGDLKDIEGVYGLQRAFKLAGAGQMIMSLWQVPDRETKDFMLSFYKNWISDTSSIRNAFKKTQLEFRQRFVNPYQWAGFVLLE